MTSRAPGSSSGDAHFQMLAEHTSGGLDLVKSGGMAQIEQPIDLRHVPTEAPRQLGLLDAIRRGHAVLAEVPKPVLSAPAPSGLVLHHPQPQMLLERIEVVVAVKQPKTIGDAASRNDRIDRPSDGQAERPKLSEIPG